MIVKLDPLRKGEQLTDALNSEALGDLSIIKTHYAKSSLSIRIAGNSCWCTVSGQNAGTQTAWSRLVWLLCCMLCCILPAVGWLRLVCLEALARACSLAHGSGPCA